MKKIIIIFAVALLVAGGYMMFVNKNKSTIKDAGYKAPFESSDDARQNTVNKDKTIKQDNGAISSQSSATKQSSANTVNSKPSSGNNSAAVNNLSKLESDLGTGIDSQNVSGAAVDESVEFELGL